MKINITTDPSKSIGGYNNYFLQSSDHIEEIKNIVNNCCEEIIFTAIDYVPENNVQDMMLLLLSKLRLGGRILISGINFDSVVRASLSGQISEKDFSQMIENIKSIRSRFSVASFLKSRNMSIQYSLSKGSLYEISATRQQ
jgi:hypothetical protein